MSSPPEDALPPPFRALFEEAFDALLLFDDGGSYVDVNPAATELFGVDRESFRGRPVGTFLPDTELAASMWDRFEQTGSYAGEVEIRTDDGARRRVRFAIESDISPGLHVVSVRELTEETGVTEALESTRNIMDRVFETAPEGIVVLGPDGTIRRANGRAEEILGLSTSEVAGRQYDAPEWVITDHDGAEIPSEDLPFARVLETGESVWEYEHAIRQPNGARVLLSVNAAPVIEDGEIRFVVASVTDRTERAEHERSLRRQNERLNAFASIVSHDLRSPLAVARGWLTLAETGEREAFTEIEAALERMDRLIEELLTLARRGALVDDPGRVDLAAAVEEAWRHTDHGETVLVIDEGLGTVDADGNRLVELLENLFRNSVEHGSTGRRTQSGDAFEQDEDRPPTVRVERLPDGFAVVDEGPGIPESITEAVFNHGYTTDEDGTGLGLAIVAAIADAHGWTVTAKPGPGGRIEVRW
ncbi:PAS domain S-box protein [Natronomonas sp. EA1]|uniref:PAS domain S-box protein n=1 Tax=Natronomonas sp. EA1 TaxID=3421655 RepID=UPI003EB71205